jgi:hypothetical protein
MSKKRLYAQKNSGEWRIQMSKGFENRTTDVLEEVVKCIVAVDISMLPHRRNYPAARLDGARHRLWEHGKTVLINVPRHGTSAQGASMEVLPEELVGRCNRCAPWGRTLFEAAPRCYFSAKMLQVCIGTSIRTTHESFSIYSEAKFLFVVCTMGNCNILHTNVARRPEDIQPSFFDALVISMLLVLQMLYIDSSNSTMRAPQSLLPDRALPRRDSPLGSTRP